jgi:patatin-like phospholipase/acyl hydrolase
MHLLNENPDIDGVHELPKPCDYFDMIAGTSTGGWVLSLGASSRNVFG